MTSDIHRLKYGDQEILFRLIRRARSTLEIAVEPDTSVVITAPLNASMSAIEAKLRKRAAWVIRQQKFFAQFSPRTPERRYVPGETHLYLGRQYRLKVFLHKVEEVKLRGRFIILHSRNPKNTQNTQNLLDTWYKQRAQIKFPERIEQCLMRFPQPKKFHPKGLIIRRIKKRWGSLSPSGRLLLNLRLIQAPIDAIDYVITHELCHVAEPHHGPAFHQLLTMVMPDWERRKQRLEQVLA